MNAIEERRARAKRRKGMKTLTLSQTRAILRYISDADQPEQEHGGFHDNTILAARSALHHLNGSCKCGARKPCTSNAPGQSRTASGRTLDRVVGASGLEGR